MSFEERFDDESKKFRKDKSQIINKRIQKIENISAKRRIRWKVEVIRIFKKPPLFISIMNNSLNFISMKLAIADLELQNKSNIFATAKKYNVVESTFRRRWKDQSVFHEETSDIHKQHLSSIKKEALITQINQLTNEELLSINRIVRNLTEKMIQSSIKKNWARNFWDRHENRLKSIYLRNIDSKRMKIEYASLFQRFYQLIKAFFQWIEF